MNDLRERHAQQTDATSAHSIAICVATGHPTLPGRVQVQVDEALPARWVPTMRGLRIRPHDRVLMAQPNNWAEPVVVGVLDGLLPSEERPKAAAQLELMPDEALRIVNARNEALLELSTDDDGRPRLTLVHPDLELSTPGELRLSASAVSLCASRGDVRIDASHDVIVTGEVVHLN